MNGSRYWLIVWLFLVSVAFCENHKAFPWKEPTPQAAPWVEVQAEAIVQPVKEEWLKDGEPEPCVTAPNSGLVGQWFKWSLDDTRSYRISKDGEIVGWHVYEKGKEPRWVPRIKTQDPIDQRAYDRYHWRLGPSSCTMATCPIHRQWILEKDETPKVQLPQQNTCPTGKCPTGG